MTWLIFHSLWYLMVYTYLPQHRCSLILEQNLNCSNKKYNIKHPNLLQWHLNFFLNYSYRFLNRHELRNIHQGRKTSQNTVDTHYINKGGRNICTKKSLNIFLTDKFLTLYLHGHALLRKSSNMILSLMKIHSSCISLPMAMEFP